MYAIGMAKDDGRFAQQVAATVSKDVAESPRLHMKRCQSCESDLADGWTSVILSGPRGDILEKLTQEESCQVTMRIGHWTTRQPEKSNQE